MRRFEIRAASDNKFKQQQTGSRKKKSDRENNMQVRRLRPLHKALQQPCSTKKSQQLLSSNAKPAAFRTI